MCASCCTSCKKSSDSTASGAHASLESDGSGRAIINYPGFYRENFRIVAAFDGDRAQVGSTIGEFNVQSMDELSDTVIDKKISIGIVAVPAQQAQNVIDVLIENNIKGILNYAPVAAKVPMNIVVRNIDPVLSLQSMTFYLRELE